ncbi:hemolysin family protein [Luedemannella helvata]|uniref:Hemolysin family protein n=1 Tax=Luedemannella helvata TaxID=349315 RepID=A0ABP4WQK9_9ACTN
MTGWVLLISVVLLALNGFFVAAEFALVAAKRHRLEQAAAAGSKAAAAAVAGSRELSMMLAGAQLGITLCTLGLGALAKPEVAHLLGPVLDAVGLPEDAAYVVAFILAVAVVGFLHVVVGEMAPKSWAISHPEDSALLVARPFRAFTRLSRPVLVALNGVANACLRLVKVTPQDELAQAHGPQELRLLLDSSREHGTLPVAEHELLTAMLKIQQTTVGQIMVGLPDMVRVPATATAAEIESVSRSSGRSRLFVTNAAGRIVGLVHVRDAVRATTAGQATTAAALMSPPLAVPARTPVARAVRAMREARAQLAEVVDADGRPVGAIALEDLLEQLIGQFDDETDPLGAVIHRSFVEGGAPPIVGV